MRIESVTVRRFQCIGDPGVTVELGPGLNVIHGPNEAGKTTLLRALQAGLTLKATITGKQRDAMAPRAGGHPEVEVAFDRGGTRYELRKEFKKQNGKVELVLADGSDRRTLAGEEAEDALREAMGVRATARQPQRSQEHLGIWPLLWVEQGASTDPPSEQLTETAQSTLSQRLSEASGQVLSGEGDEQLLERAKERYARYYTEAGQERTAADSPLKQARDRFKAAETQLAQLREQQRQHGADVDEFARLERGIADLEGQIPELRRARDESKTQADAIRSLKGELEKARQQLETKREEAKRLRERAKNREQKRAALEKARRDLEDKQEKSDHAKRTEQDHASIRPTLASAVEQAESERARLKRQIQRIEAHVSLLREQGELEQLERQLREARTLHERIVELKGKVEASPVTEKRLEEIEKLARRVSDARVALEAASAGIEVRAKQGIRIAVDGTAEELESGARSRHTAAEPSTVEVGDVAEVHVTPGGEGLAERREELGEAETRLGEALERAQAATVQEARDAAGERRGWEQQIATDQRLLQTHAPEGIERLESLASATRSRIDSHAAQRDRFTQPDDDALPEERAEAERWRDAVAEELESVENRLEDERQKLAAHDEQAERNRSTRQLAEQARDQVQEDLRKREQELEREEKRDGTDEALEEAAAESERNRDEQARKVERREAELAEKNLEQAEAEEERAGQALETAQQELSTKRGNRQTLAERLSAGERIGLHEKLDATAAEHETARSAVEAEERRATASRLLYETLAACRDEARSAYLGPLREEVQPLLSRLFPAASLGFDESFQVTGLDRPGSGADGFHDLSEGAREQVGLVGRLAMARLLARDEPLAVMLDDALVSTDGERLDRMGAILQQCARDLQVILTTCHWERYRRIGVPSEQIIELGGPA